MPRSNPNVNPDRSGADRDPDRLARFGRPQREPTVRGALARRLNLTRIRLPGGGGGRRGGTGAGTTTFDQSSRSQRVVVKTHHSRHGSGPGRSKLARHVSYLARDSASRNGERGVFYDAHRDAVEARDVTRAWEADRHHFRVIISAEKAADIADLRAYVREVMSRIDRDLGTKIEWVAIDHHNTDNAHTHVLLRGAREDGHELVIARHYVAHGMRHRASEVATELLGERTKEDIRSAKAAEVRAERFTSLDRMIERGLEDSRFDTASAKRIGFANQDRDLVLTRLQVLATLGMARKDRGTAWRVEPDFRCRLTDLGARNDIIKQLHSSLGTEARHVRRMDRGGAPAEPVSGVLVAKGAMDEISDIRFVAVRDRDGTVHYARVRDGQAYHAVRAGDIVELGHAARYRQQVARQATAVAERHGGVYRAEDHGQQLRAEQTGWTEANIASAVSAHVRRLDMWAGRSDAGVRRGGDGSYRVDQAALERFLARSEARGLTDIRAVPTRGRQQVAGHARGARGQEAER